jgi:hypothetical protein
MCVIVLVSCFLLLIFKQISNSSDETLLVTYSLGAEGGELLLSVLVESVYTVKK